MTEEDLAMTDEQIDATALAIARFSGAVRRMEWAIARRAWGEIVALHPWVIKKNPDWVMLDQLFARMAALARVAETLTRAVH